MGFFEAVLIGLQFKRLQKPIVFFMMLLSFIFFLIFGGGIVAAGVEGVLAGKTVLSSLGLMAISIVPFSICFVCAHFIKKCVQ